MLGNGFGAEQNTDKLTSGNNMDASQLPIGDPDEAYGLGPNESGLISAGTPEVLVPNTMAYDNLDARQVYQNTVGASVYTFKEDLKDKACTTLDHDIVVMEAETVKYQDTNSNVYDGLREAIPVDQDLKAKEQELSSVFKAKARMLKEAEDYPRPDREWRVIDARNEYFQAKDSFNEIIKERAELHAGLSGPSAFSMWTKLVLIQPMPK